jgi:hypothetical protein
MANFRLADADADDLALTELSREEMTTDYGAMVISRGDSFFSSLREQYGHSRVVVCHDKDYVLGMGVVAHIHAVLFGEPSATIGYFNQLRSRKSARGLTFLSRAYRYMREECRKEELPLYITSILEENHDARRILESGRAGLPSYIPVARLGTVLMRSSALTKFILATREVKQHFALSTSQGVPYSWDQRSFRSVTLRHPTLIARCTATLLFRSIDPLFTDEIDVPLRYLTNWEKSPEEEEFATDSGEFHALTLDVRDARYGEALQRSSHTTYSTLYAVSWDESALISRLLESTAPVYVDAGLL